MGQKINPIGLRIGINKNWNSRWVAKNGIETGILVVQDEKIRKLFFNRFVYAKPKSSTATKINAEIVNIVIERPLPNIINIFVHCCQPGIILGKNSENLVALTKDVNKIVGRKVDVTINVVEYKNPFWSARVVARKIADLIENRIPYRQAQKSVIREVKSNGIKGIKTTVSGRLNGVEMARKEGYMDGEVPLTSLRADLDYAVEIARTTAGVIGVKVWLNRGEILKNANVHPLDNQVKVENLHIKHEGVKR